MENKKGAMGSRSGETTWKNHLGLVAAMKTTWLRISNILVFFLNFIFVSNMYLFLRKNHTHVEVKE